MLSEGMQAASQLTRRDGALQLAPRTAFAGPAGLSVGGVPVAQMADQYGTPAYIVDVEDFIARARSLREGLAARRKNSEVIFASKAFPALAVYSLAVQAGLSIDVSGEGELVLALAAGTDPAKIYHHGNAKTNAELQRSLDAHVGTIVIDNRDEFDRLEAITSKPQDVMVRILPEIEADTHPSQLTGGRLSKFGVPLPEAKRLVNDIRASRHLNLIGIHVHVGSQILDLEPFAAAVRSVAMLGDFEAYDVGGGLGVRYTYANDAPSISQYLDAICDVADAVLPADAKVMIEPGRAISGPACLTLYRIVSVKRSGKTFVAVDGGMGDNLDVALTGQRYEAGMVATPTAAGDTWCDVVGRHCESGDTLISGILLAQPVVDELLFVPVTGAYTYPMANNYNGALRAPVIFAENGATQMVVARESYDDALRHQKVYQR